MGEPVMVALVVWPSTRLMVRRFGRLPVGYAVGAGYPLVLFDTDDLPALGGGVGGDRLPLGVKAEPVGYLVRTGHPEVPNGTPDRA